jgi:DNA polymerase III delta subunit
MPAHSVDSLFRSLAKGEISPVYYLYGPEDVLKDEAIHAILERTLDPGMRDFNLDQRYAGQLDADEVHTLCNTLPMMADRRVVIVREVEAWRRKTKARSEFLRYLERPSPDTVVVLLQGSAEETEDKDLARAAYAVRLDPLPSERASKWVLRRAGMLGLNLDSAAAEHLVQSVGSELGPLSSELAKLASLPVDEPLTPERVGELIGIRQGETQWDWRAAVLEDQPARAVSLLPAILAQPGMSGVKLVTLLGTTLIAMGISRSLYDKGLRAKSLEEGIFKALIKNRPAGLLGYREEAARWTRILGKWPAARIGEALKASLSTDKALKSTTISDERGVLTDLILRLGIRQVEAA